MRKFLALLLLLLILPAGASACFGPKLYFGTGNDPSSDVLYAVISLYIKEKTGTETIRVSLEGKDPLRELREDRLDLALVPEGSSVPLLLKVRGWDELASGKRPLHDLQFTTVAPALKKLGRLLTPEHLESVLSQVKGGAAPAAAARRFLAGHKWI